MSILDALIGSFSHDTETIRHVCTWLDLDEKQQEQTIALLAVRDEGTTAEDERISNFQQMVARRLYEWKGPTFVNLPLSEFKAMAEDYLYKNPVTPKQYQSTTRELAIAERYARSHGLEPETLGDWKILGELPDRSQLLLSWPERVVAEDSSALSDDDGPVQEPSFAPFPRQDKSFERSSGPGDGTFALGCQDQAPTPKREWPVKPLQLILSGQFEGGQESPDISAERSIVTAETAMTGSSTPSARSRAPRARPARPKARQPTANRPKIMLRIKTSGERDAAVTKSPAASSAAVQQPPLVASAPAGASVPSQMHETQSGPSSSGLTTPRIIFKSAPTTNDTRGTDEPNGPQTKIVRRLPWLETVMSSTQIESPPPDSQDRGAASRSAQQLVVFGDSQLPESTATTTDRPLDNLQVAIRLRQPSAPDPSTAKSESAKFKPEAEDTTPDYPQSNTVQREGDTEGSACNVVQPRITRGLKTIDVNPLPTPASSSLLAGMPLTPASPLDATRNGGGGQQAFLVPKDKSLTGSACVAIGLSVNSPQGLSEPYLPSPAMPASQPSSTNVEVELDTAAPSAIQYAPPARKKRGPYNTKKRRAEAEAAAAANVALALPPQPIGEPPAPLPSISVADGDGAGAGDGASESTRIIAAANLLTTEIIPPTASSPCSTTGTSTAKRSSAKPGLAITVQKHSGVPSLSPITPMTTATAFHNVTDMGNTSSPATGISLSADTALTLAAKAQWGLPPPSPITPGIGAANLSTDAMPPSTECLLSSKPGTTKIAVRPPWGVLPPSPITPVTAFPTSEEVASAANENCLAADMSPPTTTLPSGDGGIPPPSTTGGAPTRRRGRPRKVRPSAPTTESTSRKRQHSPPIPPSSSFAAQPSYPEGTASSQAPTYTIDVRATRSSLKAGRSTGSAVLGTSPSAQTSTSTSAGTGAGEHADSATSTGIAPTTASSVTRRKTLASRSAPAARVTRARTAAAKAPIKSPARKKRKEKK